MRFVLRMAWRETRAAWTRLVFFFVSMAVGVAAIVALRSIIGSVRATVAHESRALIAADVLIQTHRPFDDRARAILSKRFLEAPVRAATKSIETTTMVRPEAGGAGRTTLVELRAVGPEFPFYGEIELGSGRAYSHRLLAGGGALVRPELLARLGLAVGESVRIGSASFTIRDVIVREPGRRLSAFNLGPRVLIDYADIEKTGIIRFGSRVSHQILLAAEEEWIEPLVENLRKDFQGEYVVVRSFREAEDRVGRRLVRTENYLSLVGFIILILGGIGVWSVVRVFVQQKLKSIAVLKCVGATTRLILGTYVLQVLGLGAVGSVVGVGLAKVALRAIPPESLGIDIERVSFGLTVSAVAQGLGVGILVSLLFSLVPLLEVKRVKPLLLLRPGSAATAGVDHRGRWWRGVSSVWTGFDRWQVFTLAVVLLALVGLAGWQAGSLQVGAYVMAGFAGVALALHLVGLAVVGVVAPLGRRAWFPLRHAVIHVSRPGNQTRVILLAVGVGAFFILTAQTIETDLLDQFAIELREDAPDMFVIDIQPDQAESLRHLAQSLGATRLRLVPVLRARVTGILGRELNLEGYEEVREKGWLAREFVVTYRDRLEENEKIVAGRFWDAGDSSDPEVSVEDSISEDFGIQVGDTMRFDILGREVSARVTSIREVEWSDSRNGGFMLVFRPGTLEGAPHTFLGFMKGPAEAAERGRFQRELVDALENVSIVDLQDILEALRSLVEKVSLAISVVGAVALLSGGMILVGSVAMTRFQRQYEIAIFRTLGASKKTVATMMLLEYGTLGALAGLVGALGAQVMTWALSRQVLEISWEPAVGASLAGIAAAALGVSAAGVAATLGVLKHKPLSILRAE